MEDRIQTKHPIKTKRGVRISRDRYEVIRQSMVRCLKLRDQTYTTLSNCVGERLKGKFTGSIRWYVEVVKLDLEARRVIKRLPGTNPQQYRLIQES